MYIYDILVFSENEEKHAEHLKTVLTKFRTFGLEVNEEKAVYFKQRVGFLGYIIEANRIKPDHDRTQGIRDFPVPKTVKEVRRFIALLGYERRFLEKNSDILRPLYEFTKKSTRFM